MPFQETFDVDAVAAATLECRAVAGLHHGDKRFVATYLPGRRVIGVRAEDGRVLVSVVLAYGASVETLEKEVRSALAPLVEGREIDVHVADVDTGEEEGEEQTADARDERA
ncbi:MAG TPA: hypothetical protein VK964_04220 [Nocardioidaceae bacterium]|nr:hypothetical protein [Nocardioidaceae bacterium]